MFREFRQDKSGPAAIGRAGKRQGFLSADRLLNRLLDKYKSSGDRGLKKTTNSLHEGKSAAMDVMMDGWDKSASYCLIEVCV